MDSSSSTELLLLGTKCSNTEEPVEVALYSNPHQRSLRKEGILDKEENMITETWSCKIHIFISPPTSSACCGLGCLCYVLQVHPFSLASQAPSHLKVHPCSSFSPQPLLPDFTSFSHCLTSFRSVLKTTPVLWMPEQKGFRPQPLCCWTDLD